MTVTFKSGSKVETAEGWVRGGAAVGRQVASLSLCTEADALV